MCQKIQPRKEYFVKETIFNGQQTKESERRFFAPTRTRTRNFILSVMNETRYCKIDQENITHLKVKWMDYGDILFEPFKQNIVVKKENRETNTFLHSFLFIYLFVSFM